MADTPPALPEWVSLLLLSPAEAVQWMQDRGMLAPTFSWMDLWQEEHSRMFTVAKMARLDLLQVVYDAVSQAVTDGTSLRDFQMALTPILQKAGWWGQQTVIDPKTGAETTAQLGSPQRLELIYDVNLRQAYSSGRWQRAERNATVVPFMLYRTKRDERVRASHKPWDGIALPIGDPWWDTHYPPNGWRCRCIATAITQSGLDALTEAGMAIQTDAPPIEYVEFVNKRTGAVERVPRGIDPGFAFNPGKLAASEEAMQQAYQQKMRAIAEELRREQERLADGITFTVDGASAFQASLQQILHQVEDIRPLLDGIGQAMESQINVRFDLKRDPGGDAWAPWSQATIRAYNRADVVPAKGGGHEVRRRGSLLDRTGLMRQSLSHVVNGDSVQIGFARPYALYHELGTSKMPRRGLIMDNAQTGTLGARDMAEILAIAERFLGDAVNGA